MSIIALLVILALANGGMQGAHSTEDINTVEADDLTSVAKTELFRLVETGETRLCLTYTKIDGVAAVAKNNFLFVSEGTHYLNTTQSDCYYNPNVKMTLTFGIKSGNLCRNNLIGVNSRENIGRRNYGCALGIFREVELVPLVD